MWNYQNVNNLPERVESIIFGEEFNKKVDKLPKKLISIKIYKIQKELFKKYKKVIEYID